MSSWCKSSGQLLQDKTREVFWNPRPKVGLWGPGTRLRSFWEAGKTFILRSWLRRGRQGEACSSTALPEELWVLAYAATLAGHHNETVGSGAPILHCPW